MFDKNKQKNKLAKKGFTLIEILIVVAIIGMLVLVGSLKRKESIQRKQTEMEALAIKQTIELARDYALTGEVVEGFVPRYFQFGIDTDSDSYWIKALDDDETVIATLQEEDISDNIGILGATTINYSVPHAECNIGAEEEITVCGGDKGSCDKASLNYIIKISGEGTISIE
jgi:prepilin-type N-terminal cleavage/methylation domain-containing protein